MARKNVLSSLMTPSSEKVTPINPAQTPDEHRGHVTYKGIGALGAVTRSIDALAARADAAKEIEAKLNAGEVVIELEPDQIEELLRFRPSCPFGPAVSGTCRGHARARAGFANPRKAASDA